MDRQSRVHVSSISSQISICLTFRPCTDVSVQKLALKFGRDCWCWNCTHMSTLSPWIYNEMNHQIFVLKEEKVVLNSQNILPFYFSFPVHRWLSDRVLAAQCSGGKGSTPSQRTRSPLVPHGSCLITLVNAIRGCFSPHGFWSATRNRQHMKMPYASPCAGRNK